MKVNTFYQYITYSPIICRLVREIYALVGADIPPGSIEDIPQTAKTPVLMDHGWTDDGRIWVSYQLNTSNVRNGVFTLPAAFKGLLSGGFFIKSSGTGSRTIISAEGDRLTGLHRPIAIRGGQPDDVIVVAFDPRRGCAELRFGEEDSRFSNETSTDAASSCISFGTTPSDSDRLTSPITADLLMGVGKKWRPISTAPVEEDLEVRLEDPFGRYILLFPCKLVPGRGWINSRLETPLRAEPVDWRHWDEASIHF